MTSATHIPFRRLALVLACTSLLGLSACDTDPAPSAQQKGELENTRLAVTRVGQPFEVEGCQVQAHRVTTSTSLPNFTLATVNCPTAKVEVTNGSCGKSCTSNALRVEPKAVAEEPLAELSAEQAAKAREVRARLQKLNEQVKTLERELQVVEKSLDKR